MVEKRLRQSIEALFPASSLEMTFRTGRIIPTVLRGKLPSSMRSNILYHFEYSRREHHIGSTNRNLSEGVKEHIPG